MHQLPIYTTNRIHTTIYENIPPSICHLHLSFEPHSKLQHCFFPLHDSIKMWIDGAVIITSTFK